MFAQFLPSRDQLKAKSQELLTQAKQTLPVKTTPPASQSAALLWWNGLAQGERIVAMSLVAGSVVAIAASTTWAIAVAYMARQKALFQRRHPENITLPQPVTARQVTPTIPGMQPTAREESAIAHIAPPDAIPPHMSEDELADIFPNR